jgi:hypothetical protein
VGVYTGKCSLAAPLLMLLIQGTNSSELILKDILNLNEEQSYPFDKGKDKISYIVLYGSTKEKFGLD